jgi:hypothetical protein
MITKVQTEKAPAAVGSSPYRFRVGIRTHRRRISG